MIFVTLFRVARAWLDVKRIQRRESVSYEEAKRMQSERLRRRSP